MDLDDRFLKPTETLLEPGSMVQYEGVRCIPDGNWVPLWNSTIKLSLMPWLLNLVLPLTTVVLKDGSVNGLVVLMALLVFGCACTSFLVCVAQHTTFQDFDMFSGLCWLMKSNNMSVIVVPIETGTFFKYSVVGSTNNRASMLNV